MRVYKFLSKRFAFEALRNRRLKISQLSDLNDPFDLLPFDVSEPKLRRFLEMTMSHLSNVRRRGILCFSLTSSNPVVWAHYAEKHYGMCLGFDVSDTPEPLAVPVEYVSSRKTFPLSPSEIENASIAVLKRVADQMLFTKYADWHYEDEARMWASTDDPEGELFFVGFGDVLRLREVIVGIRCLATKRDVEDALDGYPEPVEILKAGAALDSFSIVSDASGFANRRTSGTAG